MEMIETMVKWYTEDAYEIYMQVFSTICNEVYKADVMIYNNNPVNL